jgi:hypothetical protein
MAGMADEQQTQTDLPGWRTGAVPAWMVVVGLVVLAVGGLGLASTGSAVGIAAVAVLEAAVVGLLYSWVSSVAPR